MKIDDVRTIDQYREMVAGKAVVAQTAGFEPPALHHSLKTHQAASVEFAVRQGRSALFLDTGLGKTFCALEWGGIIARRTNLPVLMLAPLAVGPQHAAEAERWEIDARYVRGDDPMREARIWITNYEQLPKLDPAKFAGVILDESSILKSFTGKTTRALIEGFACTPYRLACTATPAPNDHMELGQHAEFLGAMNSNEMLSRWFISDQTQMGAYRIKRGAVRPFWGWVGSWSRMAARPSDIGGDDAGYVLPPLNTHRHVLKADISISTGEYLFRIPDMSATSIHAEKRLTNEDRADAIAEIVAREPLEKWVIWCDTDYEQNALAARLPDFVDVRGSLPQQKKEERIIAFSTGEARGIITKPRIAGYGLNWQHCARMAFCGLSFSYENYYQAIRRCWRFGQTRAVDVHLVMADTERAIYDAIARKKDDHETMKRNMMQAMREAASPRNTLDLYHPTHTACLPFFMEH